MKHRSHLPPAAFIAPSRRQILHGAGAVAAASLVPRWARAQAVGSPLRLICWPLQNGAESRYFYPDGDAAKLSTITEPLRKHAGIVSFIKGVNVSGSVNHYAIRSTYTGANVRSYTSPNPTVKSIDQLVADSIAEKAPTPIKSLHLGVIPADSINAYQKGQSMSFFAPEPVDYEANPVTAFDRLFGGGSAQMPVPAGVDLGPQSLALLEAEMADVGAGLVGAQSELDKLALHRRALEGLHGGPDKGQPGAPMDMLKTPMASVEKLRPMLEGNAKDAYKHAYFSDLFDAQLDVLARALTFGLTRVATLQAGSADNDLIVPVGRGYPHHVTSHGNQATFSMVQNYYFGKMARLLDNLNVPDPLDPPRTVLDNTVIVMVAECLPVSHSSNGVPTMLVGKLGGKIRAGSYINQGGITNKHVMATILRAFGLDGAQFGSTLVTGVLEA